jgi:hypothetical protein
MSEYYRILTVVKLLGTGKMIQGSIWTSATNTEYANRIINPVMTTNLFSVGTELIPKIRAH